MSELTKDILNKEEYNFIHNGGANMSLNSKQGLG
jgi:hypothetical protein